MDAAEWRKPRGPSYPNRNELKKKVGRFLMQKYRETGLSRKEAAERIGIGEGYLNSLLSGKTVLPGPEIVEKMARSWGFPILEFYMVSGLFTSEDVRDYMQKQSMVPELAPADLRIVYSRLSAMSPDRREQMSKTILSLLDAVEGVAT